MFFDNFNVLFDFTHFPVDIEYDFFNRAAFLFRHTGFAEKLVDATGFPACVKCEPAQRDDGRYCSWYLRVHRSPTTHLK